MTAYLIPIISVPTTAGTGSEITPWASIWDMEEKKKYTLHLPQLFSEAAIYDPLLTLSASKELTITTGLDALSHALESIWNRNCSGITISYAIKAATLIMATLPALANDLQNRHLRAEMLKGCMYAGLAFSNTQTAVAHALSYYITAHKGLDHGLACSFTLPMLVDKVIGKHQFIDDALLKVFGELSSQKLRKFLATLHVSTEFSSYGISKDELDCIFNSLENYNNASNSLVNI